MQENKGEDKGNLPRKKWLAELTPQARHGFFACLTLIGAILVFVLFTLIFEQVPGGLDMTENKIYSLSDPTEKLLKNMTQDVEITLVWQKEVEQEYGLAEMFAQVDNVLQQYVQQGRNIHYKVVDPIVNPELVLAYTSGQAQLGHGSIIVATAAFSRVIPFELWVGYYGRERVKLNVEGPVSNAILYVLTGKMPKVYTVIGHNGQEPSLLKYFTGQTFQDALVADNFQVLAISLQREPIPADADMVVILSPQTDLSTTEIAELENFLARGGRIWVNLVLTEVRLSRLMDLLAKYGLYAEGLVAEGDEARLLPSTEANPLYFVTTTDPFPITQGLGTNANPVIMGQVMALLTNDESPRYVTLQPLLHTSDKAVLFGRNSTTKDLVRLKENEALNIAYAISVTRDEKDVAKDARLFISSGDLGVISNFPASAQFYIQGLRWLAANPDSLNIPSRNLVNLPLSLTVSDFVIFSFIFVIALPVLLLVAGFAMWNKRRRM